MTAGAIQFLISEGYTIYGYTEYSGQEEHTVVYSHNYWASEPHIDRKEKIACL